MKLFCTLYQRNRFDVFSSFLVSQQVSKYDFLSKIERCGRLLTLEISGLHILVCRWTRSKFSTESGNQKSKISKIYFYPKVWFSSKNRAIRKIFGVGIERFAHLSVPQDSSQIFDRFGISSKLHFSKKFLVPKSIDYFFTA